MRILLCIVGLVMLAGCDGHSVVPVSGHVTLDGQPLTNAVVLFEPIRTNPNPGMGSVGKTDADGRFVLRQIQPDRAGAIVGTHRVTIRMAPTAAGSEDSAPKNHLPTIKDAFEVLPGGSIAEFHLVSEPKPPPV
jgi:hypothetical protein